MIAPELRTRDLEPDGFAWLNELAGRLLHRPVDEIQVLHRAGVVLSAVRTRTGAVHGPHPPTDDPRAAAADLRARTGADRVTMLDADGLDDLARVIDASAGAARSQVDLMADAALQWHGHPAVVVDPLAAPPRWPGVVAALARVPPGSWGVLGAWRDGALVASLLARWGGDGIDLLTSADHLRFRPARDDAPALIDRIERDLGPVALALLADADALEGIAAADDPWSNLFTALAEGTVLAHRGLEVLERC